LIVYEYPFNERIRTLLRLEDLYEKFSFFLHQSDPLQHHVAIATIFEMLEVAGRADLKSDLLQELDRQKNTLIGFKSNPNVQADMLDQVINDVERASSNLMGSTGKTGQHIRDNEWLMSIRGRTIIPGGACEFDLPSYHAWKKLPAEKRFADISTWFAPIAPYLTRSMSF
jgi:cell division protein ZapD